MPPPPPNFHPTVLPTRSNLLPFPPQLSDPSAIGEALSAMADPNGRDDAKKARHAKPAAATTTMMAAPTRSKHATAASSTPPPLSLILTNIKLMMSESPGRDASAEATAADEGNRASSTSGPQGESGADCDGITDVLAQAAAAGGTPPSPLDSASDCVVCLEISRQVVLLPCRHLCLCEVCSRDVQVCPVCRGHVTDKMSVFMS